MGDGGWEMGAAGDAPGVSLNRIVYGKEHRYRWNSDPTQAEVSRRLEKCRLPIGTHPGVHHWGICL